VSSLPRSRRRIYKGHRIDVEARPRRAGWSVRIAVYDARGTLVKTFDAVKDIIFSSEAEARRLGSYLARDWIDQTR
jgi:hypothetical protein